MVNYDELASDIRDILNQVPLWKVEDVLKRALEVLGASEPTFDSGKKGDQDFYHCGCCRKVIARENKFCPWCGKKVNWDD